MAAAGCSSSSSNQATPDAGGEVDAPSPVIDANPNLVTFSYTPGWAGVQSVEVLGQFGQDTDWTAPFVTLTQSGSTFSGTAMLPAGTYPYVFHVVGDASDSEGDTASRYAIDPASAAFTPCPAQSPTYNANEPNPCGQLTMPQGAPPPMLHVTGKVVLKGAPATGYLVLIERNEVSSHHFFANRVTTGADGTYDLTAAAGQYRLQVMHPDFEMKTDAQLVPTDLKIVRRSISSAIPLAADVALDDAEVSFADYGKFAPLTTAKLPTTFTFGTTGALPTRLEVYGTGMAGKGDEIGDPWFSSAATTTGTASFDGTFTTAQANETAVALGERYFWGVEQAVAKDSRGVSWTRQSMVLPMTWH